MSSKKSANKAARQAEQRRLRNRSIKTGVKTSITRAEKKVATKGVSAAEEVIAATSKIDRAASKGVFHRNKAARLKSRLTKKLNALASSSLAKGEQPRTSRGKGGD